MSTQHAFMHDIQSFVVTDAIADFDAARHEWAVGLAARSCSVVTATAALLDVLAPSPP